ncbi:MAG: SLC13 family permease [Candidatus Nanopelagicales bacterium]|nr:SLC13 family permease [Candidatus Nanopelagicales bacterium]MCU0299809.1 SLC13 family permease [Candidatus Nanopelagicales bacterium]
MPEALTLMTLGVVVVLFVWNRIPVELVAVGSALALYALGVLTLPEALAGFGDPAVILIAALFVVSEALDSSGVTTWVGQSLVDRAGSATGRLLLLTMLLAAGLTAVIGLNGTVATLVPMVVVMALRQSIKPSRLLMPLAFAGSAGGMLLLTGSPVNVVISEAAEDAGVGAFGFLEFALVGIPLVAGTIAIVLLLSGRLLPERQSKQLPPDLSGLAGTLVRDYSLDNVVHLRVQEDSTLIGHLRSRWDLTGYAGVRIITVLDADNDRPSSQGHIEIGDRLTMVGDPDVAARYAVDHGLDVERVRTAADVERDLLSRDSGAAEVLVPPRSVHVDSELQPSMVIEGSLIVLAITRGGEDLGPEPQRVRAGDTLLVEGPWSALDAATDAHDLLVVNAPEMIRRQTVPLGRGSLPAIVILLAMVFLLATGLVPPVVSALSAALAMVLFRVITIQQAYRGISWTTVLLVAGMIPMATAVTTSGAGELVATGIVNLVGDAGPTAIVAALFVITVVFGQLISNTATALVMIPIAVAAADQLQISPQPILMSVCVAAAVAFLTPVATPANMIIMGPAGYRFGDYWRLGLPLVGLFAVVGIFLVPVIWPF